MPKQYLFPEHLQERLNAKWLVRMRSRFLKLIFKQINKFSKMKQNIIFISLFTILFIGCSKDDNFSEFSEIPANQKFFNEAKTLDGTTTLFSVKYNNDKNVESIELDEIAKYVYNYNGNRITSMDIYLQDSGEIIFSYDGDGRINAFSENGMTLPVFYNAEDRSYFYEKSNGDQETIYIDEDGDPVKFESFDLSTDELETITVTYEDDIYKGTFTNTNNPMLETCIAIPYYSVFFLIYNLTKKPVKTLSVGGNVTGFTNTYDNQGFLQTSAHETGDGISSMNFNYIKL